MELCDWLKFGGNGRLKIQLLKNIYSFIHSFIPESQLPPPHMNTSEERPPSYNDTPPPRYSDGMPPPNYSWDASGSRRGSVFNNTNEEMDFSQLKIDSEVIPAPDLLPDPLSSEILQASTAPTPQEEFNLYASTRVGRSRTMSVLTNAAASIASDRRVNYLSRMVSSVAELPRGLYQSIPGDDLPRAKVWSKLL
jgi:hypothetical protein